MRAPGEQEPFAFVAAEEILTLTTRQAECLGNRLDGRAVLLHQELDRAIGEDGTAPLAAQKVLNILRDRHEAQEVLPCAASKASQEAPTLGMLDERPGLINQQLARA